MEPSGEPSFGVLVVTVWPDEDPTLKVRARFVLAAGPGAPSERAAAAGTEDIVEWFHAWLDRYVAESRPGP